MVRVYVVVIAILVIALALLTGCQNDTPKTPSGFFHTPVTTKANPPVYYYPDWAGVKFGDAEKVAREGRLLAKADLKNEPGVIYQIGLTKSIDLFAWRMQQDKIQRNLKAYTRDQYIYETLRHERAVEWQVNEDIRHARAVLWQKQTDAVRHQNAVRGQLEKTAVLRVDGVIDFNITLERLSRIHRRLQLTNPTDALIAADMYWHYRLLRSKAWELAEEIDEVFQERVFPTNMSRGQRIVAIARNYLGIPYVWGGASSAGVNCSGLVLLVHWRALGISLPHFTGGMWAGGKHISRANLLPGDVVFYRGSAGSLSNPRHVGIYIGGNRFIEARRTGTDVMISTMRSGYAGARRYW